MEEERVGKRLRVKCEMNFYRNETSRMKGPGKGERKHLFLNYIQLEICNRGSCLNQPGGRCYGITTQYSVHVQKSYKYFECPCVA